MELLDIQNLSKKFSLGKKHSFYALRDVNLRLQKGETLGIVGESGCGKSTLARVLMGIHSPSAGRVLYRGEPLDLGSHRARLSYAEKVQMIFQDTYASLDPRMTVESIISEGMEIHGRFSVSERRERVHELLSMVGLPVEAANRYPHEFSGGQRQRIGIARALCLSPELLICDEPISALDMSVQSQVMNLLQNLKESLDLTYIFIAHDLSMVRYISDRIAVLYAGSVVEEAPAELLYNAPAHPYTKLLMSAALSPDPDEGKLTKNDITEPEVRGGAEGGCAFLGRCYLAEECCKAAVPQQREVSPGHRVACYKSIE